MLYTLKEAAKELNVSYSTICHLKNTGQIDVIVMGPRTIRIHSDDLINYINNNRQRTLALCPSTKGTELSKYRLITTDGALEKRLGKARQSGDGGK